MPEIGDPNIEKIFNIFYGNKIDTAVGNLFLDGLINSNIKSLKSSVIESCQNLRIEGDLSLVLNQGIFFPWNATGPEPLSTGYIFSPGVWTSPYNYNSNNLIRISKNVILYSPEHLYLSDALDVSGTMKISHLSSVQNTDISLMTYSALPIPTLGDGPHRLNKFGIILTSYINLAQGNDVNTIANSVFNQFSNNQCKGSLSQVSFSGNFYQNNIFSMDDCIGIDFIFNNVSCELSTIDFTASVLQTSGATKYHFQDNLLGNGKMYYFNNGTMNVTDSNF
jgi:hypothetical protein